MKLRWLVTKDRDKPVLQYWDEGDGWNKPRWVDVPFTVENNNE